MLTLPQIEKLFASAQSVVDPMVGTDQLSPLAAGTALGAVQDEDGESYVQIMLQDQPDLPVKGGPEIATFVFALVLLRELGKCRRMDCWAQCRAYSGSLLSMMRLPPPEVLDWIELASRFVHESQVRIMEPHAPDQLGEAVLSVIAPEHLDPEKLKAYVDPNTTPCASHPDGWHRMGSAPGDSMDCLCGHSFS